MLHKYLSNPPPAPCYPMFTFLENQPSCSWWRIPIHSCPWSVDNCPPFARPVILSHPTHRSSYNVYIDNISNTSRPRLAHYQASENFLAAPTAFRRIGGCCKCFLESCFKIYFSICREPTQLETIDGKT